jgi:hypothetical protein
MPAYLCAAGILNSLLLGTTDERNARCTGGLSYFLVYRMTGVWYFTFVSQCAQRVRKERKVEKYSKVRLEPQGTQSFFLLLLQKNISQKVQHFSLRFLRNPYGLCDNSL